MTTERLAEHRTATLDIYCRLLEVRSKAKKPIPEAIAKSHKNLVQNRFLLAIIGKVKAGKSTFINALLKKELLPTDALQATAAVIEIFHAERPFLQVTYANGATEEVGPSAGDNDLTSITQKLREVAAIRDEERDLPIAQLNDFIIERYSPDSKQAEWEPEILDLFLQSDLPNIHKISESELRNRSRDYLEQHRDGKTVAMRVELGFPSDYTFDFRIVDTPGIYAKGGFAERTRKFLINADAVIYLHKEEPAEETLHNALQTVIPEKAKKYMLLVLTHKCQRTQQANDAYLSEAQKCCPQITNDRIFIVDSLTEIVLQAIYGKNIDQIKELCGQNEEWLQCIANAFIGSNGNSAELFELLEKQSNMRRLRQEIYRMSQKSLGIQIETVLRAIEELYSELAIDAAARRDLYGANLKDSQQFAAEMTRAKEKMVELEAESAKRIAAIQREFNLDNPDQRFGKILKTIIENAEMEINGKEFGVADTAKTADDYLNKINQDVDDCLQDLESEIKSVFRQKMSEMETSLQSVFDITVPKIPLTELLEQLKKESTKTVNETVKKQDIFSKILQFISNGKLGTYTREVPKLDATSYFSAARSTLIQKLGEIKQSVADSVKINIERVCVDYKRSIRRKLDERRHLFDNLQRKKLENDDVEKCFNEESTRHESAKREIAECERILGNL